MTKKIVFWYLENDTWGQTSRIISVIETLKAASPQTSVTVIHEGKSATAEVYKKKANRWIDLPDTLRSPRYLENLLCKLNPELLVLGFFPFGRAEKLAPITSAVGRIKETCKVISLWEAPFPTYPLNDALYQKVKALCAEIDTFLFMIPESIFSLYKKTYRSMQHDKKTVTHTFNLIKQYKHKFLFVGFTLPYPFCHLTNKAKATVKKTLGIKPRQKVILVSRGGSRIYPKIITEALKLKKKTDDDLFMLISTGQHPSAQEEQLFQNMGATQDKKGVILQRWFPDFSTLIQLCDWYIGTGGSSVFQRLKNNKSAIIIPYSQRGNIYESLRGHIAQVLGDAVIIPYEKVTYKLLTKTIRTKSLRKKRQAKKLPATSFRGIERIVQFLSSA